MLQQREDPLLMCGSPHSAPIFGYLIQTLTDVGKTVVVVRIRMSERAFLGRGMSERSRQCGGREG